MPVTIIINETTVQKPVVVKAQAGYLTLLTSAVKIVIYAVIKPWHGHIACGTHWAKPRCNV